MLQGARKRETDRQIHREQQTESETETEIYRERQDHLDEFSYTNLLLIIFFNIFYLKISL